VSVASRHPINLRVIRIAIASVLTGLMIGLVGGVFRWLLLVADRLRNELIGSAHAWPYAGWLLPVLVGALGAGLARMLVVRFAPFAAGSGIQRVEAVYSDQAKPAGPAILPVKFLGGLLALGSGLVLGREGPTVQMGASLAPLVSKSLVRNNADSKIVEAAGAGAGLAVAFNAPIGGSVFVFEELTSTFNPWLLLATLSAATIATWTIRLMLGNTLDFEVSSNALRNTWMIFPFLALGVLLGAAGVLYNHVTLAALRFSDRFGWISSVYKAALIGAVVGLVAWFAPMLGGGGDPLTQAILSQPPGISVLLTIFLLRFLMGPLSYAAGTPGGLFAPILVLGASFGALFAAVVNHFIPALDLSAIACAVVGMSAFFSACVRAPLTGIVLAVEMTGRGDLTLGLLAGSLGAMVAAMLIGSDPIYESLKRRMLQEEEASAAKVSGRRCWELRPFVPRDRDTIQR